MVKDTSVATIDNITWESTLDNRCPQGGPGKARARARANGRDGSVCQQPTMMAPPSLGLSLTKTQRNWDKMSSTSRTAKKKLMTDNVQVW